MQVVEESSLESFATDEFRDRSFFFFFRHMLVTTCVSMEISQI